MLSKYKSNMIAPILVAVVYLLLLLSRIIKITEVTGENEYIGAIVLQLLIFLIPGVIYSKLKGEGYALRMRLHPIGGQQILVSIIGAIVLICGFFLLRFLFFGGEGDGGFRLYDTFYCLYERSAESFVFVSVAYAAVPAFCEEFFFRSLLCAEYEEYGVGTALVMSSLLYGMVQYDLRALPIHIFAGCVLFAVHYATGSVLGCIIAHFCYNMAVIFGKDFAFEVYNTTGSTELFILLLFCAFLLFGALFCGEAARLYRKYARENKPSDYVPKKIKNKKSSGSTVEYGNRLAESLLAPPALGCYLIFVLAALL